jgi:hypothetical protein
LALAKESFFLSKKEKGLRSSEERRYEYEHVLGCSGDRVIQEYSQSSKEYQNLPMLSDNLRNTEQNMHKETSCSNKRTNEISVNWIKILNSDLWSLKVYCEIRALNR